MKEKTLAMNKSIYLFILLVNTITISMDRPQKRQKTSSNLTYLLLHNAFLDNNFEQIQEALQKNDNLKFNISYSKSVDLLMLEILVPDTTNKSEKKNLYKHTLFFETEARILPRIKCLLVNNIRVTLEKLTQADTMSWHILAPTLAKFLLLEASDPDAYAHDPEQYLINHPSDFDPVARYPKDFDEEITKREQTKLNKLIKQHGSVLIYLRKREIGLV